MVEVKLESGYKETDEGDSEVKKKTPKPQNQRNSTLKNFWRYYTMFKSQGTKVYKLTHT